MSFYEPLFYNARVDFVVNGHVHAYERCVAGPSVPSLRCLFCPVCVL